MSRPRLPKIGLATIAVALVASCTSQPVVLPSRDFNRPTDVAFVCMGTTGRTAASASVDGGDAGADRDAGADGGDAGGTVLTGLPMRDCHPRGGTPSPDNLPHRTYAFLPNSESGDLSVINADTWKLVNLDPQNAGYNTLPLGVLPTQIAASDDGCRLVTANHGSCDLSLVDPAALLAPTFSTDNPGVSKTAANATITTTVVPKTKSGVALHVLPGEVTFLPRGTLHDTKPPQIPANVCDADWSWQALVTFPSCDLVALLDMPSGTIAKAAYVRRTTDGSSVVLVPIPDGTAPVCPISDCASTATATNVDAAASVDGVVSDGGNTDAGAGEAGADASADGAEAGTPSTPVASSVVLPPLGVGPLAMVPESGRVYVGLANAPFIVPLDVATNVLAPVPGGGVIALQEGAVGVNRLRLSIDPYLDKTKGAGSSGISGTFIGDTRFPGRQYLYAVARDGTLRVVQVAQDPAFECETNYDPLSTPSTTSVATVMSSACIPVDPMHRRPLAIGPGIRPPAPPVDIAVANISPVPTDQSETSVTGVHAWMLTANGNVYLVNIDPIERKIGYYEPTTPSQDSSLDPTKAPQPPPTAGIYPCLTAAGSDCEDESKVFGYPPPPNTLRNQSVLTYTPALGTAQGLPRLDVPSSEASVGPRIESVWTQGSRANDLTISDDYLQTEVYFPDLTSVTPQTWNVTWQGALMSSPRFSGEVKSNGAELQDLGTDFCRTGVEPTDLVTFTGCIDNTQCGIGKTCVAGDEGTQAAGDIPITGLCLAPGTSTTVCAPLLSTIRRYEVTATHQNVLEIQPHKDELVRPSLAPCHAATKPGADGGAAGQTGDGGTDASRDGGGSDGAGRDGGKLDDTCVDPLDPSTNSFACFNGRCLVQCDTPGSTNKCRTGRVCVDFGSSANTCDNCFCADGPDLTRLTRSSNSTNLTECLGELFPYQASVGRGFLVSGSQAGVAVTQMASTDKTGASICVPVPSLDSRVVSRISMDAPHCANVKDDSDDSRCYPNAPNTPADCVSKGLPDLESKLEKQDVPSPDPCLFLGGPTLTDPSDQNPTHVRVMFRNREIQFMMTNLEQPISTSFQIRFDVHGGFQPQLVTIPSTVEVTMPTRIVVGPFDSSPPAGTVMDTTEVPYLFVVDQRRLGRSQGGGPTRGQFLRIQPRGFVITTPVTGYQPWFEDLTNSLNLFPIQ
jgi:hypothetical protein